jgi:serine/threonine-protein kinase RsbW
MENLNHKLPSNIHSIAEVEKIIEKVREELNLNDSNYGNILVALTEAINNAIKHGNQFKDDKIVDLIIENNASHRLEFIVKDEGSGFDYSNLPDPTAPENIEKESGRGIFLMRNLADEVKFSNNGSEVHLIFNISKN